MRARWPPEPMRSASEPTSPEQVQGIRGRSSPRWARARSLRSACGEAAGRVAETAAWASSPKPHRDREAGAEAARRALHVEGDPTLSGHPVVIELRPRRRLRPAGAARARRDQVREGGSCRRWRTSTGWSSSCRTRTGMPGSGSSCLPGRSSSRPACRNGARRRRGPGSPRTARAARNLGAAAELLGGR